jgi:GDP-L-fucose synthase
VSKKDRIFVAGHNGLVGSAVLRKLKKLKFSNIIVAEKKKIKPFRSKKSFQFFKKK